MMSTNVANAPTAGNCEGQDAACPICGGTADYDFSGRDLMYGLRRRYDYYQCRQCGGIFQHPMPVFSTIASFYPSDYSVYDAEGTHRRMRPLRLALLRLTSGYGHLSISPFWRLLAILLSPFLSAPGIPRYVEKGRMLDVGCGNGRYLSTMRALGWQAEGVEFSADGVRACRLAGLAVHHGDLHSAAFPDASFDLVTVRHVVEHIPEPQAFMDELVRVLKPGGMLILETPNSEALGRSWFGPNWYHNDAPRHLILFSPRNLSELAERHGLRVAAIEQESSPKALLNSIDYVAGARDVPSRKIRWRRLLARLYVFWSVRCNRGDTFRLRLGKP